MQNCKMNIINFRAFMVPGTVDLDPAGVIDLGSNSIAVADVRHAVRVTLNVR